MLETLRCTALKRCPARAWHAVQTSSLLRQSHFGVLCSYRIFLREKNSSCHFYYLMKSISLDNLLLHNDQHWLGAAYRPSSSCGQGTGKVQHWLGVHVVHLVEHSTGLHLQTHWYRDHQLLNEQRPPARTTATQIIHFEGI